MLYTAQNGKKTLQMTKLQCDFFHPGDLDKVDQSDYWKITTHSKIESKVKKKNISDKLCCKVLFVIGRTDFCAKRPQ